MGGACSANGGSERCIGNGDVRERDHLEDPDVDGTIILRRICRKWSVVAWIGTSWLRIGTGGGLL